MFNIQVFYAFGAVGLVWTLWWERLVTDIGVRDPGFAQALEEEHKTDVKVRS